MLKSRKSKWILGITAIILLYVAIDIGLWANNKVTVYSNVKRYFAHAPEVTAYGGKQLAYQDTVSVDSYYLEKFNLGDGEYKDQLYKDAKTPDKPPFIFLHKSGNEYFKYKYPQFPFAT